MILVLTDICLEPNLAPCPQVSRTPKGSRNDALQLCGGLDSGGSVQRWGEESSPSVHSEGSPSTVALSWLLAGAGLPQISSRSYSAAWNGRARVGLYDVVACDSRGLDPMSKEVPSGLMFLWLHHLMPLENSYTIPMYSVLAQRRRIWPYIISCGWYHTNTVASIMQLCHYNKYLTEMFWLFNHILLLQQFNTQSLPL